MRGKLALLALDEGYFALPVEGIVHIVSSPEVFQLPLLPPGVGGVFLYQDQLTPLLDLRCLWGQDAARRSGAVAYTVVCSCEVGLVGVPVDRVLHIVDLDPALVKTVAGEPAEVPAGTSNLFVHGDREFPILNVDSLLISLPPKTITRRSQ
ncbi:hypothetical protein DESUT3_14690 [Desulfuromonas versatilis]|uniref:CheW-like domain-containing protein n=1 Tax=Desulfuromonas versatilis TaxID=2802975 RepID=A0ABN6DW80_9BACT|nr:chemotaxis protein CheW [Desulfuromonas versatilis]BCR04400.1 hypothetical protein DESUT3_14690 [Desulfuromonas versatilis]